MNKVHRNRLLVGMAAAALVAVVLVVNQYYPLTSLGSTKETVAANVPESIIEACGVADVVYYKAPEKNISSFLGQTPIVGIGLIYYAPGPFDQPYYVELTSKGYNIVRGVYDWNPDELEDPPGSYRNKYNVWSWEKFRYYEDNALFVPGRRARVHWALNGMAEWYSQKKMAEMFFAVFQAAMMTEGEWRVIEIDLLALGMPKQAFAIGEGGKPEVAVVLPEQFVTTIVVARASKEKVFFEGKWIYVKTRLDQIVENDDFNYEKLQEMLERGQIQFVPSQSLFGMREYMRGINCEWQGREIEMLKEAYNQ